MFYVAAPWLGCLLLLSFSLTHAVFGQDLSLEFLNGIEQLGYDNWTVVDQYTVDVFPPVDFSPTKHVPVARQIGHSRGEVIVPHAMDPNHFIQYIWVTNQNGELLHAEEFNPEEPVAAIEFDYPVGTTLLVPFEYCNEHGRWRGEPLELASPKLWNQTLEFAYCSDADTVEQSTHINIDESRYIKMSVDTVAKRLSVKFHMPIGSWMGLGVGSQMVGSDIIMVQPSEVGSSNYICNDTYVTTKSVGPEYDSENGGVDDSTLEEVVVAKTWVEVTCSRPLSPSDMESMDRELILDQTYSFIEAHGDSLPLSHHGISNRVIFQAKVEAVRGTVVTPNDTKRDLFVMHGIVMSVTWGVLIPFGAAVVRYQKHCVWWLGAHRLIQITGTVITIPTMLLANSLVTDHFQTTHSILGFLITIFSGCQSGLGLLMVTLGKMSRRLTEFLLQDEAIKKTTRVRMHREIVMIHQDYLERRSKIFQSVSNSDRTQLVRAEERFRNKLGWFKRTLLWPLLKYKYTFLNPIHRMTGRLFVLVAFIQMYLGLILLDTSPVLDLTIYLWTGFFGAFVLYKELEKQLYLPRGLVPKFELLALIANHGKFVGCGNTRKPETQVPQRRLRRQEFNEESVPDALDPIEDNHSRITRKAPGEMNSSKNKRGCIPRRSNMIELDSEAKLKYRTKYQDQMPGIVLRLPCRTRSEIDLIPGGFEALDGGPGREQCNPLQQSLLDGITERETEDSGSSMQSVQLRHEKHIRDESSTESGLLDKGVGVHEPGKMFSKLRRPSRSSMPHIGKAPQQNQKVSDLLIRAGESSSISDTNELQVPGDFDNTNVSHANLQVNEYSPRSEVTATSSYAGYDTLGSDETDESEIGNMDKSTLTIT